MPLKITHHTDRKTSSWAGGTTTELLIFPARATFVERNFSFRLSQATVDAETSEFTPLPGVQRTLMILDGELKLTHEGHHTMCLRPLDSDTFDGGWKTTAEGRCTDFNLMTRGETKGTLEGLSFRPGEQIDIEKKSSELLFIYLFSGKVVANLNNEAFPMTAGDFGEVLSPSGIFNAKVLEQVVLVVVRIKKSGVFSTAIRSSTTRLWK